MTEVRKDDVVKILHTYPFCRVSKIDASHRLLICDAQVRANATSDQYARAHVSGARLPKRRRRFKIKDQLPDFSNERQFVVQFHLANKIKRITIPKSYSA